MLKLSETQLACSSKKLVCCGIVLKQFASNIHLLVTGDCPVITGDHHLDLGVVHNTWLHCIAVTITYLQVITALLGRNGPSGPESSGNEISGQTEKWWYNPSQ